MSMRGICILIMILVLSAILLRARETVSLSGLISAARENNNEIRAVREKRKAAEARVLTAKTWDQPQLNFEYWSIPEGSLDIGAADEKMYGFTQMIPFPGKLSARGGAAKAGAESAAWDLRDTELKTIAAVKGTYARYYALAKSVAMYRQTSAIMRNFSKVAESRYITGRSQQSDVLRAQVEAEKMANMALTLEQEKESTRVELNLLAGRSADSPLGEPEDLAAPSLNMSWDDIRSLAVAHSPGMGKAAAELDRARAMRRGAQLGYLPDFELGFRRKQISGRWSGSDAMFGVTVPLWFWKQGAEVKEAAADEKALQAEKDNAGLMAVSRAREVFTRLEAARRLIDLYHTSILPKSEQSLQVAQASFAGGRMSFLELLDSTRAYIEFTLDYYNAMTDYYRNLADLERIAGAELQ